MSPYQDVADACRSMHAALDKVLAQIPMADEFWATRDMIDTEKVCLDTFKGEAAQARTRIRQQAQDEKDALRAEYQEKMDKAQAAHGAAMLAMADAEAKARERADAQRAVVLDLQRQVSEERANLAIELAKNEMAAKELAGLKASIASLQASMGALFQKAV